mgnify:CR=1 FL=1
MINYDLTKVKAIIFDVDGVLSAETIGMDDEGQPLRTVNIKDGYAIQLACKMGLHIAIMTGGRSEAIVKRYTYLGVGDVYINCSMKMETYQDFKAKNNVSSGKQSERLSVNKKPMLAFSSPKRRAPMRVVIFSIV